MVAYLLVIKVRANIFCWAMPMTSCCLDPHFFRFNLIYGWQELKETFLPVKPIFFVVKTPHLTRGPGDRSWPCRAVSRSGRGMNIAVVNPDGSLSSFQAMGMLFTEGPCLNLFLRANILIKQDKTNIYSCFTTENDDNTQFIFFYWRKMRTKPFYSNFNHVVNPIIKFAFRFL